MLVLQDLTQSLSLEIDWGKTYVWALQKNSKVWWTVTGTAFLPDGVKLPLVDQVKELGSLFTFGRRTCSAAFNVKCKDALSRLSSLSCDPQGIPVRARVVQSGIWPFLFYGTEACLPSLTTVAGLRSAAARAVAGDHKTLSPWAALCLTPGVQDPEVFLLCHHLSQLRRCFSHDAATAEVVWDHVVSANIGHRAVCGPAGALQHLLSRNGWTVRADGVCRGPLHQSFDIRHSHIKALRSAVTTAWADTVHDNVRHRNGMLFAPVPCLACPRRCSPSFARGS